MVRDFLSRVHSQSHPLPTSQLRNEKRWDVVLQQLKAGANVVLLANHQSEADAAFIPLMTASSHPEIGEKVIYVAGDRVTSDLMAKPFSMGRNLLNVHSKKYMDAEPALKPAKMRQNLRTLKEMERLLKEGGKLLWIAPSGGRDRKKEGVLSPDRRVHSQLRHWRPTRKPVFSCRCRELCHSSSCG